MNACYPPQINIATLAVKSATKPHKGLTCYSPFPVTTQFDNDNLQDTERNEIQARE